MRIISLCLALAAALAALANIVLVAGALLDPTSGFVAMIGALVWTTWGPHLVLIALASLIASAAAMRWGARAVGGAGLAISAAALAGSVYIVATIIQAVRAAGGVADPLTGLALGPMTEPQPDAVEIVTTVEGKTLTAAIFRPSSVASAAPIIAYLHGGGFMAGTNTETAADLRWFADRGFLVVSLDYRVFGPGNPTWNKAPADAACGLAWTYGNAVRLGGDPARIVLLGDSAGGNLAINLAYAAGAGTASSTCGTVPVPVAVAVQYPAVDPIATYERGFPIPGFEPAMLMAGYIGGAPSDFPDRIKAIASETYINPGAPPTLIIAPEKDSLVVSDGVYGFADKAKAAGIDLELVRIPFANHIYNQMAANSLGNQAGRSIRLRFLQSRLN
jgi:acetyl esterase/lipase